jgi:hypothetical protein
MSTRSAPGPRPLPPRTPSAFEKALERLRGASVRPEVTLAESPAPSRLAPEAVAITGEVVGDHVDAEASGRFVLLHDPDGQEAWHGAYRVIVYVKAVTELEMANDPMLSRVGWDWLHDALDEAGASFHTEAGTVTRVLDESFGGLAEEGSTGQVEIRASWTPSDQRIERHLRAWSELLCMAAGLPPVPDGVTALPRPRSPV